MDDVEARVNDLVLADLGVHAEIMSQEEAVRSGAMALFGEKYGDQVRVVSVGDWARELCGGTHARPLRPARRDQAARRESSIGSGVRRVEALVGADAYRFLAREHVLVAQLTEALKARPEELPERVNDIVERLRARREGDRAGPACSSCSRRPASSPRRPRTSTASVRRPARRGRRPAGDVRTLALDVRGRLPGDGPGVAAVDRVGRRQAVGRGRGQRRGAVRPGSRPTRWCGRPRGPRRQRWRQGRRRPGRRHRREQGRRGAGRDPAVAGGGSR